MLTPVMRTSHIQAYIRKMGLRLVSVQLRLGAQAPSGYPVASGCASPGTLAASVPANARTAVSQDYATAGTSQHCGPSPWGARVC